jgi:N-acetylmuramoyl-L-alanine amidase
MAPRPTPRPRTRPSPLVPAPPGASRAHRGARTGAVRPHRRAGTVAATVVAGAALTAGLSPAASAETSHQVRPGETVSGLAARFAVGVDDLVAANDLTDPDRIVAGTTLVVPAAGGPPTGAPAPAAAAPAAGTAPAGPTPVPAGRRHLEATFDTWATANGLPPSLLKALCYLESGWQHDVVSATGAVGICQLMPATAADMSALIGVDLDRAVPEHNIRMGARYLRWLLDHSGGDVEAALAGYYQGVGSVERDGPFAETRRYVADVVALQRRF